MAHAESNLALGANLHDQSGRPRLFVKAINLSEEFGFHLHDRLRSVGQQPVNFGDSLQHGHHIGLREPRDMAAGISLLQPAQERSRSQHIPHGRKFDNQNAFAVRGVVGAAVALPLENAGLVPQKMAAIIVGNHRICFPLKARHPEGAAIPTATTPSEKARVPLSGRETTGAGFDSASREISFPAIVRQIDERETQASGLEQS